MIRLDELTKRYPGQETPAVDAIDLEIPEGEIVILVGPSGCGKTTTLEMINRLIEPTSGRIFLEDDDVTHVNADQLRRRMGYVIQQIGLFPHQTIAQNIATVPRMLDWDNTRIANRVDELLDLVGLDPDTYRDRYPKEMSGGQRQRVGVARAMAADPPVMLMDEPFGATDPITRERLQNEFLRIQDDIRKTIVFVTHDIDEAIKMGDRIAIMREGSHIAQYDTPEHILSDPASEFVEQFLGSGIVLKRLNLSRVHHIDISTDDWPTIAASSDTDEARALLRDTGRTHLLLLDDDRRPQRWIGARDLGQHGSLHDTGTPVEATVDEQATLNDALQEMLVSANGVAVVVDRGDAYVGTVDLETIIAAVREMRAEAHERDSAVTALTRDDA
ncbi:MAG: betaine/proline/choline family ABC transporter ATP-binding protein [Actinobacteria bacterium]|nr:betaine/proline/choline family ABC transporter ATP-binding protein [Actinomycetota bacterium]